MCIAMLWYFLNLIININVNIIFVIILLFYKFDNILMIILIYNNVIISKYIVNLIRLSIRIKGVWVGN